MQVNRTRPVIVTKLGEQLTWGDIFGYEASEFNPNDYFFTKENGGICFVDSLRGQECHFDGMSEVEGCEETEKYEGAEGYSDIRGKRAASASAQQRKLQRRQRAEVRRSERKQKRFERKIVRHQKLENLKEKWRKFKNGFKVRRDARRLKKIQGKNGKQQFADVLPVLTPQMNAQTGSATGNYIKTNDDGSHTVVPSSQVTTGQDGNKYSAKDLQQAANNAIQTIQDPSTGKSVLAAIVPPQDTTTVTPDSDSDSPDGQPETYRTSDVQNDTKKWLIIGGISAAVITLGIVAYVMIKKSKNKGK